MAITEVRPRGKSGLVRAASALRWREYSGLLTWHRLGLVLILALSALLNSYRLAQIGYANTYYAAAVLSMSQGWHTFFFNSFDPGGFVTVDKPPLGFWVQVLSVKIFGFHGWSILLPEALAGIAAVALLYWLVRRQFGPVAGLVAALVLTVTPISVATNRNNTIDSLLVLTVLAAAWAVSMALERGRNNLGWLLLGAVFVGLGFNIKMLEAYLVLPALWLAYLVAAPPRWFIRVAHLALATIVLLVVSFSWAVAVDLTPADQRPYVGSSQTNSVFELALGYNGLQRLFGRAFGRQTSGFDTQSIADLFSNGQNAGPGGPGGGGPGGSGETGPKGALRLLNPQLGGQIGWLIPLALVGLIVVAWHLRPRRPFTGFDSRQGALVIWGMWFLTMATFFSVAGYFHRYYLSMLAPGVAALVGIGLVTLWQGHRYAARWWQGWFLPIALAATAVVQLGILGDYQEWSARLATPIAAACIGAVLVLVILRRADRSRRAVLRVATLAATVGLAALLVVPTVWAGVTVTDGNTGNLPVAGPPERGNGGFGGPGGGGGNNQNGGGTRQDNAAPGRYTVPPTGEFPGGARPANGGGNRQGGEPGTAPTGGFPGAGRELPGAGAIPAANFPADGGMIGGMGANAELLRYLQANRGTTRFLVAVPSAMVASSLILETGEPVMALGGFTGSDPILTSDELAALVANNTVRYFLPEGGGFGGRGGDMQWVTQHCTAIPAAQWQGTATSTNSGFGRGGGQQLYDCAGAGR